MADMAIGVYEDIAGAGPLQRYLDDDVVTDVLLNGCQLWVDRGKGLLRAPLPPGWGEADTRALAVRLAAGCAKRLDQASPVVDGTLGDGSRLHAVLEPVSACGTLISLRAFRSKAFTIEQLRQAGMFDIRMQKVLELLVKKRANCLISGATGTGKTTLLATLVALVEVQQRLLCIEESRELRINHPHVVYLQERRPNVEGAGGVNMSELVRIALRMRPDRLILGECRGGEVADVLTALNTGHEGGWATLHANSAVDVPARLAALGALAGLSPQALNLQAASALDAVIHLERQQGLRRLRSLAVLWRQGSELICQDALTWNDDGQLVPGAGLELLRRRLGPALDQALGS
jgi:helicase/secretion neighborhood ATPase